MNRSPALGFAQRSILYILIAAAAAGLGLVLAQRHFGAAPSGPEVPHEIAAVLKSVRLISTPRVLPDFALTQADGSTLGPAQLRGHWTIVFLGFTHCPDVCPTTLATLAQAQKQWQAIPATHRPQVLFVSVDPDRDTPKLVGDYARFFHPATLAATANEPALGRFAQALGLVYMKVPQPGGGYSMDHSATLVVLDPQGRQAGLIRPPLAPKDIADDLRRLAEAAP